MSWHTGGAAIKGSDSDPASLLESLGFPGLKLSREVDGEEASSSSLEGKAVAVVEGWTFVWDPIMLMLPDPTIFESAIFPAVVEAQFCVLSQAGGVFAFVMEGTSGTHGYAFYRSGVRERVWLAQEGAAILDEGNPLPGEDKFNENSDSEQRVLLMLERQTSVPLDHVMGARFTVWA